MNQVVDKKKTGNNKSEAVRDRGGKKSGQPG